MKIGLCISRLLAFKDFQKHSSKAGGNDNSFHSRGIGNPQAEHDTSRSTQDAGGRTEDTTHPLTAGAKGFSHPVPDKGCPETGR